MTKDTHYIKLSCAHVFCFQAQYKDMHATSVRANATHVAMNGDDDEGN